MIFSLGSISFLILFVLSYFFGFSKSERNKVENLLITLACSIAIAPIFFIILALFLLGFSPYADKTINEYPISQSDNANHIFLCSDGSIKISLFEKNSHHFNDKIIPKDRIHFINSDDEKIVLKVIHYSYEPINKLKFVLDRPYEYYFYVKNISFKKC